MNDFEKIYSCAKKKNLAELKKLIAGGACIDEFKDGEIYLSAAAALAMEGDIESAEFLRLQGASIHFIAYGAARGKQLDYAEKLRKQHGASLNYLACGAGQANLPMYAFGLQHYLPPEIIDENRNNFLYHILFGAILGRQTSLIQEFANGVVNIQNDSSEKLKALSVAGKAVTEDVEEALEKAPPGILSLALQELSFITGLTWNQEVMSKLESYANANDEWCRVIRKGFARGGAITNQRHTEFIQLAGFPLLAEQMFYGYVQGGHTLLACKMNQRDLALNAYMLGLEYGQTHLASLLSKINKMTDLVCLHITYDKLSKLYLSNSHAILHGLVFLKQHPSYQIGKKLSDYIQSNAPLHADIIKKVYAVKNYIQRYDFDYDQAVAWIEHGKQIAVWILQEQMLGQQCRDLQLAVISQLTGLTDKQTHNFVQKIQFQLVKQFIIKDMQANKTTSFIPAVAATRQQQELMRAVRYYQMTFFKPNQMTSEAALSLNKQLQRLR